MASMNKITEIIALIKSTWGYWGREVSPKILAQTWWALLKDFPDEVVEVAFYKTMQEAEQPPVPATIIKNIRALQEATEPTDEELWNEFTTALREAQRQVYYFRFTAIEPNGRTQGDNARARVNRLWEELPEKVRQYIGGKGEFIRMARESDQEDLKYEKTRFLKNMPIIKTRNEFGRLHLLLQSGGAVFGRLEGDKN